MFSSGIKRRFTRENLYISYNIKAMSIKPRIGWTRADEAVSLDMTKEITRLSSENSKLRDNNEKLLKKQIEAGDEVRDVVHILNNNERIVKVRSTRHWEDADEFDCNLLEIFLSIAPNLINENSSIGVAKNLALSLVGTSYFSNWPIGKNKVSEYVADFVALDIVEPPKKKHPVSDENSYWTLTRIGKQVLKRSRRIQLEEGIALKVKDEEADEE